ncbi:MAG: FecR domain-containing protein [Chryseolinea sp.]
MSFSVDHIDELIGKCLAGEASGEEIAFVDQWLIQSRDNQSYFDHLKTIFTQASLIKNHQQFDTDAAWERMKNSLSASDKKTVNFSPVSSSHKWWKVAAAVTLISLVGVFAYRFARPEVLKEVSFVVDAHKTAVADTLPDGSSVFLNKSTQLTYSYNKEKKEHVIKLKGEAYFDINHEETKNLVIDIDGVFIRDVGTSFNVKAYPESNTIEVVVEEGEIKFYTSADSGVTLRKHGKAVYDKTTKKFALNLPEVNALSYKTKQFNFDNSDLEAVVNQLNAVYDKEIVLDKRMEHCRLTVAFNNESIDEITAIIAETLGGTVNISSEKIIIEGNGCGAP